jgi:hypothetical protein
LSFSSRRIRLEDEEKLIQGLEEESGKGAADNSWGRTLAETLGTVEGEQGE